MTSEHLHDHFMQQFWKNSYFTNILRDGGALKPMFIFILFKGY
jgi:hypothetical protein